MLSSFHINTLLDLIQSSLISSIPFDNIWSSTLRMLLINPLHFPGPKLEACMPCFHRSKDDAGVCHLSPGVKNGAISASNFLQIRQLMDTNAIQSNLMLSKWAHALLYQIIGSSKRFRLLLWFVGCVALL